MKTVDVSLAGLDGNGDQAADTVTVEGTDRADHVQVTRSGDEVVTDGLAAETRISGSEPAADTLAVRTLAGIDSVTVAPDVGDEIKTLVDLGADG